jgi:HSP20 family protein
MVDVTRIILQRRELGRLHDRDRVSDDVRRFLDCLGSLPDGPLSAEYHPPVDVIETPDAIEIVADLPGITADGVRVLFADGAVVLAGRKAAPACDHGAATFHLVERTYGQFTCVLRLGVAVDAGRATAQLRAGELRVRLPRIEDRRGRDIEIRVESGLMA